MSPADINRISSPFSFGGLRIVFSAAALEKTPERLFPESKHRSKRIHKKLVKRFGGEFVMRPVMFRTPTQIIAHPSYRAALLKAMESGQ